MTSREVYKNYLIKVNKNDTNTNIKVPAGIFVKLYNEQAKLWLETDIKTKSGFYQKNRISDLLVIDLPLKRNRIKKNFVEFQLPPDYHDYASSYSIASKGQCKNRVLTNWDFKIKDRNSLVQDINNNPSFEYEETLINISQDNIVIFKSDFSIDQQYLTYYKYPVDIDLEGYIKEDGTESTTIDPTDLSDKYVNEIVNLTVLETVRIFENPEQYNLVKERTFNQ